MDKNTFETLINECQSLLDQTQRATTSLKYMTELNSSYFDRRAILGKKTVAAETDVYTNHRKTYYESEELTKLERWGRTWFWLYFFLVFLYCLCLVAKLQFTIKSIIKVGVVIAYPFIIYAVVRWIWEWLLFFFHLFPHTVYMSIK